jgi:hypothetical protein
VDLNSSLTRCASGSSLCLWSMSCSCSLLLRELSCRPCCCLPCGSMLRFVFARPKADERPTNGSDIDRSSPSARSPGRTATSRPTSTTVFRSRYLANSPTRPTTEGPRSAPTYITRRASPCHTTLSSDRRQVRRFVHSRGPRIRMHRRRGSSPLKAGRRYRGMNAPRLPGIDDDGSGTWISR